VPDFQARREERETRFGSFPRFPRCGISTALRAAFFPCRRGRAVGGLFVPAGEADTRRRSALRPVGNLPRLGTSGTPPQDGFRSGHRHRRAAVRTQPVDFLQPGLDLRRELKRVELRPLLPQFRHPLRIDRRRGCHPLPGCLRSLIMPPQLRPHPLLLRQLHRGQKQVGKLPQFLPVQVVDSLPRRLRVVPQVAQKPPHVRPVLLLDVGVVVLLVGPSARELNIVHPAVAHEMRVDKLRAIVGIDPPQGKRQGLANLFQGRAHRLLAAAQHRPRLRPVGVNVGDVERVTELARGAVPRVRNQVDLRIARHLHVPVVGLERNVLLEQGPRLGAAVKPPPQLLLVRPQAIVQRAGADRQQLPFLLGSQMEAPANPRQPVRQQRLQPRRPGIIRRFPRCPDYPQQRPPVGLPPSPLPPRPAGPWTMQQPDRVFAVIMTVRTELVQNPPLLPPLGLFVPSVDSL